MTMPGSHNAHARRAHTMFFANRERGRALRDCPDNDGHNVDTIDGLVLPTVVALASAARGAAPEGAARRRRAVRGRHAASPTLESAAAAWRTCSRASSAARRRAVVEETADVLGLERLAPLARGRPGSRGELKSAAVLSSAPRDCAQARRRRRVEGTARERQRRR